MINFLKRLWTASIRRQLMLGIILVHAVLMSIFVYDLVERQRDFLETQSLKQANSLAITLAANSTSWILANDVVGLEEIMQAQINYPALKYAMVLSPKGRVLGHTDIDKVGLYINDSVSRKLFSSDKSHAVLINNHKSIDVAAPVFSNNIFIGWARVNLSQSENINNLQVITRNGLLYTLLAIFVGALFAFFMAKGITQGLKKIIDAADGVKDGDRSLRVNILRHDEIGKLGSNFNTMLESLNKSERDFQAVMDNTSAVIYAKDIDGRYIFVNNKWSSVFDIAKEKIIGSTDHELFEKEFADKFRENDFDVLNVDHALNSEEVAPQKDGLHTYITVKFPLRDDVGKTYAVCGISTDITERKKTQEEKSALEIQLIHAQKIQAIGQLTGGVAHDFNNLLAVVLGYAELCQVTFGEDEPQLNKYLKEITTAGVRGRELVKQMMIYSRKDHSYDNLDPVEIEKVLEETLGMLRATFPANIKIEFDVEENIPYVIGSSNLLSQVFMNLCLNAKDSMGKEGQLFISLKVEKNIFHYCDSCHESFSGDFVSVSVKDNGEGIDGAVLNRIFEPFYTSKKLGEGTGMGLSVVHGAIHKLNGHIVVKSIVGEGTDFKILLPALNADTELVTIETENETNYDFLGLNFLIIDDEPSVASMVEKALKRCNAKSNVFNDSQLALKYFEKNSSEIDIVITDQTMPNLSGIELSEKMLLLKPDVKIILNTGHSDEVSEESALQMGIKHFMYKPLKFVDLYKVINTLK